MKLHGKEIRELSIETVVIPKGGSEYIFRAQSVTDYERFAALCPPPNAPEIIKPGGERVRDVEDADFKLALSKWSTAKVNWMILESLKATEGLEWEGVNPSDPETWGAYESELINAGFSVPEIARIIDCVFDANGLNQKKIDEATKRFLAGQANQLKR